MKTILRGVDFEVQAGEFVALLSEWRGETTFLQILASLSRPSLGEVNVAGYKLRAGGASPREAGGGVAIFHCYTAT
ncbi:MAG: hypothetical protein U0X93_04195 [Anaerolineales bacterium]